MYRILIIDDDSAARGAAQRLLQSRGHDVIAVDAADAITLLEEDFDVVVAGIEPPDTTADLGTLAASRELVCLPRPLAVDDLVEAVSAIECRASVRQMLDTARRTLDEDLQTGSPIVGRSTAMRNVLDKVSAVAASNAPVLLTGESGTGKELLARAIHAQSERRDKPLVSVNCAAFPETLIEAELFGHERGAFTGALHKRDGQFKAAHGGTLFLDEVNGLSPGAQAKLLRVLQDGRFRPIGTNTEVAVDIRLISATNRELSSMVSERTFRGDLYYRIKVLEIELPPLRERCGDLPLLVGYFLRKHAPVGRTLDLSPRAWAALSAYSFPGNVRQLGHAIQHAVVLARGQEIDLEHLPRDISSRVHSSLPNKQSEIQSLAVAVHEFEREYVRRALELARGNKTQAARLLGMSRKHLWEKLRRLGSDAEED